MVKCDDYITKFRPIEVKFAHICIKHAADIVSYDQNQSKVLTLCQTAIDFGQICSYLFQKTCVHAADLSNLTEIGRTCCQISTDFGQIYAADILKIR